MHIASYVVANALGLIFIFFVIWWFWLFKKKQIATLKNFTADIKVANGVYEPDVIQAPVGKTIHLRFHRQDKSPCSAMVLFPDFNTSAELSLDEVVTITLTPDTVGEFEFTCQMAMYRGKLVVI